MERIRINQIKINVADDEKNVLENAILKALKVKKDNLISYKIVKKSIDARKKPDIYFVYVVEACVKKISKNILKNKNIFLVKKKEKYQFTCCGDMPLEHRPVVIGFGPAGMFCAYLLTKNGYKPLIIERGSNVEKRVDDITKFWNTGELNKESNVQFGEGGAGTFSDGKLNTTVNDKQLRNQFVLETFVRFGAPDNILYDAKPHIGTDILCNVVKNMREYMITKGATVRFESKVTDFIFEDNCLKALIVNDTEKIPCEVAVLAIGHSARDTFVTLNKKGVHMEAKPFAIGVRVEHKQKMINESMYGKNYSDFLPAASYKLTGKASDGRGVYSFCMCPGGYVVNASSEEGRLVVNGMSYSKRAAQNANSAIVTSITPNDYKDNGPLGGMYLQRELEEKAYKEGQGCVPVQTYGDFLKNKTTSEFGEVKPNIKGKYRMSNIKNILPSYVCTAIEECMPVFGKKIEGFDDEDAVFSAIESRTSSPIRINRNDTMESVSHIGLYPCGEGAGYAGGITSAGIDGIKVFESITSKYNNDF